MSPHRRGIVRSKPMRANQPTSRLDPAEGVILSEPISYESAPVGGSSRPTVVTVLAIIAIVLGALGIACKPTNLLMYFVNMGGVGNPVLDKMKADNAMFVYTMATVSI